MVAFGSPPILHDRPCIVSVHKKQSSLSLPCTRKWYQAHGILSLKNLYMKQAISYHSSQPQIIYIYICIINTQLYPLIHCFLQISSKKIKFLTSSDAVTKCHHNFNVLWPQLVYRTGMLRNRGKSRAVEVITKNKDNATEKKKGKLHHYCSPYCYYCLLMQRGVVRLSIKSRVDNVETSSTLDKV